MTQRTIWKHTAHFEKTQQSRPKTDPTREVSANGGGGDQTQNKSTFQKEIHFSSIIISSWGKNVRRRENEVKAMPVCVRPACAEEFLLQLLPVAAEQEEGCEPQPHRRSDTAQPAAWLSSSFPFPPSCWCHTASQARLLLAPSLICNGKIGVPKISL